MVNRLSIIFKAFFFIHFQPFRLATIYKLYQQLREKLIKDIEESKGFAGVY